MRGWGAIGNRSDKWETKLPFLVKYRWTSYLGRASGGASPSICKESWPSVVNRRKDGNQGRCRYPWGLPRIPRQYQTAHLSPRQTIIRIERPMFLDFFSPHTTLHPSSTGILYCSLGPSTDPHNTQMGYIGVGNMRFASESECHSWGQEGWNGPKSVMNGLGWAGSLPFVWRTGGSISRVPWRQLTTLPVNDKV